MIRIKTKGKKLAIIKDVTISIYRIMDFIRNYNLFNVGTREALEELFEFIDDNSHNPSDITIYCIAQSILNHTSCPYPVEIDVLMILIRDFCCKTEYEVRTITD